MKTQTDLAGDLLRAFAISSESQRNLSMVHSVAEELGLLEREDSEQSWSYAAIENPYKESPVIRLIFYTPGMRVDLSVVDASVYMARFAKELLPKVGEFRKEFDGDYKRMRLNAEYKGVRIVLESDPPRTCTVETIEEEVQIPEKVIPAHVEKKTRYVMKGDCDPLMPSPAQPETIAPESTEEVTF